jgi:hypothetical protein
MTYCPISWLIRKLNIKMLALAKIAFVLFNTRMINQKKNQRNAQ